MIYIYENTLVINLPRTQGEGLGEGGSGTYTKAEIDAMLDAVDGRLDSLDAETAELDRDKADLTEIYAPENVDLDAYASENYYIKDDGTYNTNASYKHICIPAASGQLYKLTAQPELNAAYAFVTSKTANAGGSAHYVAGTGKNRLSAGESVTFRCPDGTKFLYLYGGNEDSGTGRENLPVVVKFVPVTRVEPVYNSLTSLATIKTAGEPDQSIIPAQTIRPYIRFIGAGYDFASGIDFSRVFGIVPGHTYRIYLKDTSPDMTGVTGGYRFENIFLKADGTTEIQNRVNYNRQLSEFYDCLAPADAVAMWIGGRCAADLEFGAWVEDLGDLSQSESILALNPESEWTPKFHAAKKRYWSSSNSNLPKPVVLAHLSDIHGNWANVRRFIEFCDKYSEFIDERIQSGDLVTQYFTNGISGYVNSAGSEKIINVIGNHDTYESGMAWNAHAGLDSYNKYIAPFVANWNVIQPSDAATSGKCYFYKDYSANSLRLVFVDAMGWNADENTWLTSVLADALTLAYDVMVVTHFAGSNPVGQQNDPAFTVPAANWQTTYNIGTSASQLYTYNHDAYQLMDRVEDFINAGGVFVGYLQGHYHKDFVGKVARYPNQMIYAIGGSLRDEVGDYDHAAGTKMQDEFEIVAVDTYSKVVKLFKVGANVDRFGTVKNSISVSYSNSQILRES